MYRFLESFVKSVDSVNEEQQGKKVHNFITMLVDDFVPLIWDREKTDIVAECLEKYIMERLFSKYFIFLALLNIQRTFAQTNEHLAKDLALYTRIQSLQFIAPDHLEIPKKFVNQKHWTIAEEGKKKYGNIQTLELQNMNSFTTPLEKLQCILKCCKEIFDGLRESCGKDKTPGVDDFLPGISVFVFTILISSIHLCDTAF